MPSAGDRFGTIPESSVLSAEARHWRADFAILGAMKIPAYAVIALLCLFLPTSCGGGSLADEMTDATVEFVDTLKGIDSKESAEAAAPKLKEITKKMKSLQSEMEALPEAEREALGKELEGNKKMTELTGGMMDQIFRLMKEPDLSAVLSPILEGLNE